MRARIDWLTAALAAAILATACTEIVEGVEDQIANDVRRGVVTEGDGTTKAGGGKTPDPDPTPDPVPDIDITNITPARGVNTGGDLIEIIGFGFEPDMVVAFGPSGVPAEAAFVTIEATRIVCRTPAYPDAAFVTVRVYNATKLAAEENGFQFFAPVVVDHLEPDRGPSVGGTLTYVKGSGFIDGSVVQFGTGAPVAASTIDAETLKLTTPARPGGSYAVTVTNTNGADTIAGGFEFFDRVGVIRVEPFAGSLVGGTAITVHGAGFINPTALQLGAQAVLATPGVNRRELSATTLPAIPALEGPVAVTAENSNGIDTLDDGFVFYDANDSTPRIIFVSPAASLVEGGGSIDVVVGGFDGLDPDVELDGNPLNCTQSPLDDHVLTCDIPPAPEGTVLLQVVAGMIVSPPVTFNYVDLGIGDLIPNRGAQAGGTFVTLTTATGSGLGSVAEVSIDGQPATDVVVNNAGELTMRTPPGDVGPASVRVETQGIAVTADDVFTYYDPFAAGGFVSGDTIGGTLNVQVASDSGELLENAFVVVGSEVNPALDYLYGFTDHRGQITISGPGVSGPLDVHGGKTGFGGFSLIQINRENVNLFLIEAPPPAPDPLPPCPQGAGAPPLITGKVRRVKDKWNTGKDYVIVTTTYADLSQQLPDPGPNSQMVSQGDYELMARTGDLVVIALAGEITADGYLDVHAMGFHPFVFTEGSSGQTCNVDGDCPAEETCVARERVSPPLNPQLGGEMTGSACAADTDCESNYHCDTGAAICVLDFCLTDADCQPTWRCDVDSGACISDYCMRVYPDVQVVIDTPLNQPMRIDLVDPPFERPTDFPGTAPNAVSTLVYYNFGYQGLHPMDQLVLGNTSTVYIDMPRRMPQALGVVPFNVEVELGYRPDDTSTDLNPPYSDVILDNLTNTAEPIAVQPILKTQLITAAAGGGGNSLRFAFDRRPADLPDGPVSVNTSLMYDTESFIPCQGAMPMPRYPIRWFAAAPGPVTSIDFPIFPAFAAGANIPDGEHGWQIESDYSPGASYQNFDLGALLDWRSRALTGTYFSTFVP